MAPSIWQILIVVVLLVLLFGRGKISALMGDVAKGIKSFKKGMAEEVDADKKDGVEAVEAAKDAPIDVTPTGETAKDKA